MTTYYSQNTGNWSTLANWNSAANGSGSSPASIAAMDDQTFIIQAGHVITFDVEDSLDCDGSVSGWTTGINGITITGADTGNTPGELTLTRTANSASNRLYGLRLKAGATIVGTNKAVFGKLTAGTSDNPIPPEATHVIWALGIISGGTINLSYLTFAMYGSSPIEPVYVLTANAAIGQTKLSCKGFRNDTNPNMETEWRTGWTISIANINRQKQCEIYELAATPVENGIINLATPLINAKLAGSQVSLTRRNIELRATGNSGELIRYGTGAVFNSIALRQTEYYNGSGQILVRDGILANITGTTVFSNSYTGCYEYRESNIIENTTMTAHYEAIGALRRSIIDNSVTLCGNTAGIMVASDSTLTGELIISGSTWATDYLARCNIEGHTRLEASMYGVCFGQTILIRGHTIIQNCNNGIIGGSNYIIYENACIRACTKAITSESYSTGNITVIYPATLDSVTIANINNKDMSIYLYDVTITGYTTLINMPLRIDINTTYATPRAEIWPLGYKPAGTGEIDRRYPMPIAI